MVIFGFRPTNRTVKIKNWASNPKPAHWDCTLIKVPELDKPIYAELCGKGVSGITQ